MLLPMELLAWPTAAEEGAGDGRAALEAALEVYGAGGFVRVRPGVGFSASAMLSGPLPPLNMLGVIGPAGFAPEPPPEEPVVGDAEPD